MTGGELNVTQFFGRFVVRGGVVSPGAEIGKTYAYDIFDLGPTATLRIDIDGLADTEHDFFSSTGGAMLDGTLDIATNPELSISADDAITVLQAAVLGSNTASGDPVNFDVTQIDPATLSLGPGGAANIALNPLYGDYDSDGNTDAAFAFTTSATGIACDDTEVTLTGETFSGQPFAGASPIVTVDCDTGCHP